MKKTLKIIGIILAVLIILLILLWPTISRMIVTKNCVEQLGEDYKAVKTEDLPKYGIKIEHSDQKWTCINTKENKLNE